MSEIQYRMLPLPSVFMMEADFPMEHVDTLNTCKTLELVYRT